MLRKLKEIIIQPEDNFNLTFFPLLSYNRTDIVTEQKLILNFHWKYPNILGSPILKRMFIENVVSLTILIMYEATLASKPLDKFWPNKQQTCILGQNIGSRNNLDKCFKKIPNLVKKTQKWVLFYNKNGSKVFNTTCAENRPCGPMQLGIHPISAEMRLWHVLVKKDTLFAKLSLTPKPLSLSNNIFLYVNVKQVL